MSVAELRKAVDGIITAQGLRDTSLGPMESSLLQPLETIWPVLEDLAGHLSRLSKLPLIILVGDHQVYSSRVDLMPPWCAYLNTHPDLWQRCLADEQARASDDPQRSLCHTGMIVAQRKIPVLTLGEITVLFGSRWSSSQQARKTRQQFLSEIESFDRKAHRALSKIDEEMRDAASQSMTAEDAEIMDSIQGVLTALVDSTINFNVRAVNMAHEIALVLQGTSLLLQDVMQEIRELGALEVLAPDFIENADVIEAESAVALNVLENFLSETSHLEYRRSRPRHKTLVYPHRSFSRLVRLYSRIQRGRLLKFENHLDEQCPSVFGDELELERAFHNVMSNAVKYSFLSAQGTERVIRIFLSDPYNTASGSQEWAVNIENYGVGLRKNEQFRAFQPGFRGEQGVRQIGFGAGIGLSEVQKIMNAHGGRARIRSVFKHHGKTGDVYVTTVALIFPSRRTR